MTKKKHPHNRAERLLLKELDEKKPEHAGKVRLLLAKEPRRKVIESLKEQETEDELREYSP